MDDVEAAQAQQPCDGNHGFRDPGRVGALEFVAATFLSPNDEKVQLRSAVYQVWPW